MIAVSLPHLPSSWERAGGGNGCLPCAGACRGSTRFADETRLALEPPRSAASTESWPPSTPDAHTEPRLHDLYELVVATILSAQSTDKGVNKVTPMLFAAYPTPAALAAANRQDVEDLIQSTGFFRNKTSAIIGMAQAVCERFGGEVPSRLDDLVTLPGVGRKTANVILQCSASRGSPWTRTSAGWLAGSDGRPRRIR